MSFTQFSFDPRIADAIRQIGYTVPTPIQQRGIPVVLEGRDMLGLAQTGTGKTASFLLPLLQRLTLSRLGRRDWKTFTRSHFSRPNSRGSAGFEHHRCANPSGKEQLN